MKKTFIIRLILTILMAISMTGCEYPADMYTNAKLSGGESVNGIVIKDNVVRCSKLSSIKFSDSNLEEIEGNAFAECSSIEEIKLPESVKAIGEKAFRGCESLRKINIPPKIKEIKEYTFAYCSSLEEVDISNRDIVIDKTAFKDSKFTYKGVVND